MKAGAFTMDKALATQLDHRHAHHPTLLQIMSDGTKVVVAGNPFQTNNRNLLVPVEVVGDSVFKGRKLNVPHSFVPQDLLKGRTLELYEDVVAGPKEGPAQRRRSASLTPAFAA